MKLVKKLFKGLGFLFLGILGGMLWQTIIIPYLAERTETRDLWFVRDYREREVHLYPRQKTIVTENEAVTEAVEKVEASVVAVKAGSQSGAGLVYTTDGLIVTFLENIPTSRQFSLWVDGERVEATVEKKDLEQGLVLLKAESNGFKTVPFASVDKLERGERVFIVGKRFSQDVVNSVVNEGIVRDIEKDFIYTNIWERSYMQGSVLFDIEGRVIGLNRVGLDGEVLTVPINIIQEFVST